MKEITLDVKNLCTRLQTGNQMVNVVDDLTFCLEKGQTLAIVGESGCGKTMAALSLLRILPSMALPPTGQVLYQGTNLLTLPEANMRKIRGRHLAMIFQDPTSALNPVYPVGDQLKEMASLHLNLDEAAAEKKVLSSMEEVGIPSAIERYHDYPHQLSGGLKQRIMIAMALICEPDILIADEPTTALDVTIQAQVLTLIRQLQHKKGMSVLLITHDMGVVAEAADDVIVMYACQGIEKAPTTLIFDHTSHPYTKGLFESRPAQNNVRNLLKPIKGQVPSLNSLPKGCRFHPRCPYKMEKCETEYVPNFIVQENQLSRCWLHDGSITSAAKLKQIGALHVSSA